MSDENIPLSGQVPAQKVHREQVAEPELAEDETVTATAEPGINFGRKSRELDIVTDNMSDADALNAILQSPEERLIAWEEIELPSLGLYYNWKSPIVKVRPWGSVVDKILATSRLVQSGQAVDQMIAHSVIFPDGFEVADLLVGDHIFLLYYLRGITHGNMYEFAVTAPSGSVNTYIFDMNELSSTIVRANPSSGLEPFEIYLPHMSEQIGRDVNVGVRFMRVGDTQSIARNRAAMNKAVGMSSRVTVRDRKKAGQRPAAAKASDIEIDTTVSENLSRMIVEIMGQKVDRITSSAFIDRLHSSDTAVIRQWLKDNSPGIDPTVNLTDQETGREFQVMLPITEAFFRPQDS